MEEYEEVNEDDLTAGDVVFIGCSVFVGCFVIAFILKQIKKTFKNVHIKVGNKLELGLETHGEEK